MTIWGSRESEIRALHDQAAATRGHKHRGSDASADLVSTALAERTALLIAITADLEKNAAMFVVLLRKVLEEVREKGYPEATIVDFKFDEELGRWVLELHEGGAAGRDVEGLDVLATEVLIDHGADELVEVVLDTCNSAK